MSLIKACGSPGHFSPSFSELQRNFVKHRPAQLKSLLRLVKHWYLEVRRLPGWGQERKMEEGGEEKGRNHICYLGKLHPEAMKVGWEGRLIF